MPSRRHCPLPMNLRPDPHITDAARAGAEHTLVRDAGWATVTGAFSSGIILIAFALTLGAQPLHVGILAAIPFLAQAAQWPATLLVERVRQRRRIGVWAITAARVVILSMAAIPFAPRDSQLGLLMLSQVLIAVLNGIGGCAVNSWLHQLVPREDLGRFFSRRLLWGTIGGCLATLGAGVLVDHLPAWIAPWWPTAERSDAFAVAFVLSALAGFLSSFYLARTPEPMMPPPSATERLRDMLIEPFRHPGFRKLLVFLAAWGLASNVAAPFISVWLIRQNGFPMTAVTSLWVSSQIATAVTLFLWGKLSDRMSNKAVLAVALPAYFACTLALVFGDALRDVGDKLAVLYVIHIAMGVAGGGIGLAIGNLGLKCAPQGRGTAYLAAIGVVSAAAGGIAPLIAGSLAQAAKDVELSAVIRFVTSERAGEFAVVQFAHWEFLFALSALLGLYVMHALSRIQEGREFSERVVIQEFAFEALRMVDSLSSIAGTFSSLFPVDRMLGRLGLKRTAQGLSG